MSTPSDLSRSQPAGRVAIGFLVVLCLNLALVFTYYDKSWSAGDDGHYIHVADRMLNGEVLHRDVEEYHPGYVHFANVLSLKAFGRDLVSLRIPLMAMAVVQSLIVFLMFVPRGLGVSFVAAMAISGIGVFQISTPLTGLYSLFFTVLIVAALHWIPPDRRSRLILTGSLLGAMFLTRQLSAVFVAMGVLTYLLLEHRGEAGERPMVCRFLLGIMASGLAVYLVLSTDLSGVAWIGIWPLILMFAVWRRARVSNRQVVRLLSFLAVGGVISFLPVLGYHLFHGSVQEWIGDAFVRSLSVTGLEHIERGRYYFYFMAGFLNIFQGDSVSMRINGLYWLLLPLLTVMNGLAAWHMVSGKRLIVPQRYQLLAVLAVFHALVSLFNQNPFYLYLSAGLSLVCFLWWSPFQWKRSLVPSVLAIFMVLTGIVYHAAQPYSRRLEGVVRGTRVAMEPFGLPGASIWIESGEAAQYRDLVEVIQRETVPGDSIFAVDHPEVYFLSQRENPFRIFNLNLSLLGEADLDLFLTEFDHAVPRLLIYDTGALAGGPHVQRFLELASEDYNQIAAIGPFRVMRRSPS